jgi:hypothetical protein
VAIFEETCMFDNKLAFAAVGLTAPSDDNINDVIIMTIR